MSLVTPLDAILGVTLVQAGMQALSGPLTVFSLHPFFMTVGLVAMTKGATWIPPAKHGKGAVRTRVRGIDLHRAFQAIGGMTLLIATGAIYYNKELLGRAHAATYHGLLGYGVVLGVLGLSFVGMSTNAFTRAGTRSLAPVHRAGGALVILAAWVVATIKSPMYYSTIGVLSLISILLDRSK